MSNTVISFTCKLCATQWQSTIDQLDTPRLVVHRTIAPSVEIRQYGDDCPNCGARAIAEVEVRSGGSRG